MLLPKLNVPAVGVKTPATFKGVPNVTVPILLIVKSCKILDGTPVVKFKVPVPFMVKLEVREPVKVPEPDTAPLMVKVLAPTVTNALLATLNAPTVVLATKEGLLLVFGMVTSCPLIGAAPQLQLVPTFHATLVVPVHVLAPTVTVWFAVAGPLQPVALAVIVDEPT